MGPADAANKNLDSRVSEFTLTGVVLGIDGQGRVPLERART